jgi:hypothetical protein
MARLKFKAGFWPAIPPCCLRGADCRATFSCGGVMSFLTDLGHRLAAPDRPIAVPSARVGRI